MSSTESVLIITDGSDKIIKTAEEIAKTLKKAVVRDASVFAGTDLLPADVVFIGCGEPSPSSFSYLYEMLQHINLAGRKCGLFSTSKKALKYLCKMVKSSGIEVAAEPLLIENSMNIRKWMEKCFPSRK